MGAESPVVRRWWKVLVGAAAGTQGVKSGGGGQRGRASPSFCLIPAMCSGLPHYGWSGPVAHMSPLRMSRSQLRAAERTHVRTSLTSPNSAPHQLCDLELMADFKPLHLWKGTVPASLLGLLGRVREVGAGSAQGRASCTVDRVLDRERTSM